MEQVAINIKIMKKLHLLFFIFFANNIFAKVLIIENDKFNKFSINIFQSEDSVNCLTIQINNTENKNKNLIWVRHFYKNKIYQIITANKRSYSSKVADIIRRLELEKSLNRDDGPILNTYKFDSIIILTKSKIEIIIGETWVEYFQIENKVQNADVSFSYLLNKNLNPLNKKTSFKYKNLNDFFNNKKFKLNGNFLIYVTKKEFLFLRCNTKYSDAFDIYTKLIKFKKGKIISFNSRYCLSNKNIFNNFNCSNFKWFYMVKKKT